MMLIRNIEYDKNSAHTNLNYKRKFIGSQNLEVSGPDPQHMSQDPASLLLALLFSGVASFSHSHSPSGGKGGPGGTG